MYQKIYLTKSLTDDTPANKTVHWYDITTNKTCCGLEITPMWYITGNPKFTANCRKCQKVKNEIPLPNLEEK